MISTSAVTDYEKSYSGYDVYFRLEQKIKFEYQLWISGLQICKLFWTFITIFSKPRFTFFLQIFSLKINYCPFFSNRLWFFIKKKKGGGDSTMEEKAKIDFKKKF